MLVAQQRGQQILDDAIHGESCPRKDTPAFALWVEHGRSIPLPKLVVWRGYAQESAWPKSRIRTLAMGRLPRGTLRAPARYPLRLGPFSPDRPGLVTYQP